MRLIIAAALVLSTMPAFADTDVYVPRNPQTDLDQAHTLCQDDWGMDLDGTPASWEFKRCMAQYGWVYSKHIPSKLRR